VSLESPQALEVAYRRYAGELYGVAVRGLHDRGLAEEAVQETFLRAWRSRRRYDPTLSSQRTWLFAILRNVVIDAQRRMRVRPVVSDTEVDTAVDAVAPASTDIDSAILGWQVEEALRRLSDEHRHVLVEVRLRARTLADVAGELGVPVGTVKSRLHYALRALRLALEEQGVEL
jgi:RNA polymerase sigma-70 factor, ECF subfamily